MKMKKSLIYFVGILIFLILVQTVSAVEISTTSYNASAHHTGTETAANSSTDSYSFRHTMTYQQPSNRDVATLSYSANSGWLNNSLYINTDELAAEAVCDSNNLDLCTINSTCTTAGGYWYDSTCNAEAEPTTPSTPSEESSGGGGTTGKVVKEVEEEEIRKGKAVIFKENEKVKFKFKESGESHEIFIEVLDVKEDNILVVIYPEEVLLNKSGSSKITGNVIYGDEIQENNPISFRLKVGEERFLDLTGDGSRDIYIKLEKIENKKPTLYIETIFEEVPDKEIEEELVSEKPGIITEKALGKMFIVIIIFAIIIIMLLILLLKKKSRVVYSKEKVSWFRRLRNRQKRKKVLRKEKRIRKKIRKISLKRTRHVSLRKKKIKTPVEAPTTIDISEKLGSIKELSEHLKKSNIFIITIFSIILISILSLGRKNITGFIVNSGNMFISNLLGIMYFALIIGSLGLIVFVHKKNISRVIDYKKRNKHPTDSIRGLVKKKVYTDDGEYVGKVEEIILAENKIHSLRIKLSKKKEFKVEGISIKYKDVTDTGHIVITNKKIIEELEKE